MNRNISRLIKAAVATGIAFATTASHASLIGGNLQNFQGTGLGAVNTILTIQSPGNSTTETGSVAWNGSGDVRTGDFQPGASQTLTRTIGSTGISSAANLRLIFNPVEPQNGADSSINLNNLVLSLFSPTGTLLFTSGAFSPQAFNASDAGTGNAGFVFQLDAAQAAAAQAAAFSGSTFSQNRIGLTASAAAATGGPDTFFVANFTGGGGGPSTGGPGGGSTAVPEPGIVAIFGLGLIALGTMTRRRRN